MKFRLTIDHGDDSGHYVFAEGRTMASAIKTVRPSMKENEYVREVCFDIPKWYHQAHGLSCNQSIQDAFSHQTKESDVRNCRLRPVRNMDALKRKIEAYAEADFKEHGKKLVQLLMRSRGLLKFEPLIENFMYLSEREKNNPDTKLLELIRKVGDVGVVRCLYRIYYHSIYWNYFNYINGKIED